MILIKPSFEILASTTGENYRYSYLDPRRLIEAAGRTCYKSETNITDESAAPFVERLRKKGHVSVLEHSWAVVILWNEEALKVWQGPRSKFIEYETFFSKPNIVNLQGQKQLRIALIMAGNMRAFEEFYPEMWKRREFDFKLAANNPGKFHAITVRFICNRGVTHELVRHRMASYSQESTRYCDYSGEITFIIPPWFDTGPGEYKKDSVSFHTGNKDLLPWLEHLWRCEESYQTLRDLHFTPQMARGVLPIDLKTEIVVTANLNEWKHIFSLRCSERAHPQIRELMTPLRDEFRKMFAEEKL